VHSFWTPVRVGLVVAASVIAFGFGLYFIGVSAFGEKTYRVYAMFDDATGLGVRSRVQIAGIPVGQVDHVELDQKTARAQIWLKMKAQYVLRRNATITKRSESILGDFLLDLTPGTPDQPPLKDGEEIQIVIRQPGMNEVFASLSKISNDIGAVTENLRKILGGEEGENSLRSIISSLQRITKGLENTIDTSSVKLNATLSNFEVFSGDLRKLSTGESEDIVAILKNTRDATAEARDILRTVGEVIGSQNRGELKESVSGVKQSLEKLDKSLSNVQQITDKINSGQGTIGRLVNDDKLIKNLEKATSSLTDIIGGVGSLKVELQERSEFLIGCTGLTSCPTGTGTGSLINTTLVPAAGGPGGSTPAYNPVTKNYFSLRVIPRPDKWYGFELIDDPRGLVRRVQVQNTNVVPAGPNPFFPNSYVQITTERTLKFSAYLAKRYGPVSGRFGILENTGGFGIKFHLFNDSLIFSADAFDFANPLKAHPRIKLYADYRFMDHLLITAGADDVANAVERDISDPSRIASGRDFFVGAGFYFTDDDIKLLFGLLPLRF
jgi:phospholipid/cholesterol/gamma-HCH transport system substrate-binding protein